MPVYSFIPARLGSSRFPGKVLADIHGKTMLRRVFEGSQSDCIDYTYITTCDEEVKSHAFEFEANVIMTSNEHERCLDRVAEAYFGLSNRNDSDIIICMQGDEPLVDTEIINDFINKFRSSNYDFAVSAVQISSESEFMDPDIVKIVWNESFQMVYTSRAPIPYQKTFSRENSWKIFGLFAFKPFALQLFNELEQSSLEKIESCDTNRICGSQKLAQHVIPFRSDKMYQAVDNKRDLEIVKKLLSEQV